MKPRNVLLSVALVICACTSQLSRLDAKSFDIIVPSVVEIRTSTGILGVGTPWGWIVATDETLTESELDGASLLLSTDDPNVTITTTFNPSFSLDPGAVAGLDAAPLTLAMEQLLAPGEVVSLETSNFWRWQIDLPPALAVLAPYQTETILHTTIEIAGQTVSFDTIIKMGPQYGTEVDPLTIVAAQRLSSVPEPSTYALAAIGSVALLAVRRRKALA